jgi:TetR/AcrR family transcriptional repressor of nem operon
MRYSKDHKAETHARIVKNASVRLREKGPAGIGVAELMKEAGLTHGGFYAHFDSRDALIAEAFSHAMDGIARRWRRRADSAPEGKQLDAIVNSYLTTQHRDDVGNGCMLPALGAEVARADPKTRKAFAARLEEMIDLIAGEVSGLPPKAARQRAMAIIATMMGSLLLSRATGTGDLSNDLIEAGRQSALALGKPAGTGDKKIAAKVKPSSRASVRTPAKSP